MKVGQNIINFSNKIHDKKLKIASTISYLLQLKLCNPDSILTQDILFYGYLVWRFHLFKSSEHSQTTQTKDSVDMVAEPRPSFQSRKKIHIQLWSVKLTSVSQLRMFFFEWCTDRDSAEFMWCHLLLSSDKIN